MKLALLFLIIVFTFRQQASLAQKPELIIPVGHSNTIRAIACSPNSEFVLTGSEDNTIILWNIKTMQKIKTFLGHAKRITDLSFYPNGKIFASSSWDKTIRLWNIESGEEIKTMEEINGVLAIKFSNDGKQLVSSAAGDSIKIWDTTTWTVKKRLQRSPYLSGKVEISKNGQFLSVYNTMGGTFYSITDLNSGKTVLESIENSDIKNDWTCCSVSKDGRWVIIGGWNKLQIRDRLLGKVFNYSYEGRIEAISISEKSEKIAIYSEKNWRNQNAKDKITVLIQEKNEWRFLSERLTENYENNKLNVLTFTIDEKKIVSGINEFNKGTGLIWNFNENEIIKFPKTTSYTQKRNQLRGLHISKNNEFKKQFQVQTISDSTIFSLSKKFKLENNLSPIRVSFNQPILYSNESKNVKIFYTRGWEIKNTTIDDTINVFSTNCLVTNYKEDSLIKNFKLRSLASDIRDIFFILNEKYIVFRDQSIFSVWDFKTFTEISKFSGEQSQIKYDFSENSNLIALWRGDYFLGNQFIVCSLPDGEEVFRYETHNEDVKVNSVKVIDNQKKLIATFSDKTLKIFNLRKQIIEKTIRLPSIELETYGFWDGNEELVILTNLDRIFDSIQNQFFIVNLKSGNLVSTVYPIDSTDWVITTPEGFFDASSGAMQKLYYVQGLETFDLEQLKERYWVPGLMQELLGYRKNGLPPLPKSGHIPLPPIVQLSIKNNNLILKTTKRDGGIGKISLLINNIEIEEDLRPNKNADSSKNELNFTIPLKNFNNYFNVEDKNILKVVAYEKQNEISTKGDTLWYYPNLINSKGARTEPMVVSSKPNVEVLHKKMSVYGVVIGANTLGLKYADKDAEAMKQLLEKSAKSFIDTTKGKVQITLFSTNQMGQFQPYKENIVNYLNELSKVVQPQDLFFMYYSGHGKSYINKYNQNDFAMLLQGVNEATKLNSNELSSHALNLVLSSRNELIPLLNQIVAVKKIFIYDACESGKLAEDATFDLTLKGTFLSREKAFDNMYSRTGVYFLSSSAKDKSSYEHPVFEHGFLTYSLLKGVKNAEGLKYYGSEAYLDIPKWFSYALTDAPKVAASVSKEQVPVFRTPSQTQGDFFIGIVSDSLRNNISLSNGNKIQLASFSFQDERLEDKLKISSKINAMIREKSFLGTNFWFEEKPSEDSYFIKCTYTTENGKIILSPYLFKGDSNLKPLPKITINENEMEILTDKLLKKIQQEIIKE